MKFLIVDKVPVELKTGEHVIKTPDFIQEIRDSKLRLSKNGQNQLTKNAMMRNALVLIGMRFMEPGMFNAFRIPLGKYEGLSYKTEDDISVILLNILTKHSPELIDSAIIKSIQARPKNTNLVYFVGSEDKANLFLEQGLDAGEALVAKTVVEQTTAS